MKHEQRLKITSSYITFESRISYLESIDVVLWLNAIVLYIIAKDFSTAETTNWR